MSPLLTTIKERISPIWKSKRQISAWVVGTILALGMLMGLVFWFGPRSSLCWGPAVAAWVALRQVKIALTQAKTAADRHEAQTKADQQRRITESFSKAVDQLASDKMHCALAVFTRWSASRVSPDDYWTVMETIPAFVRERARWREPDLAISKTVARFYESEEQQSDHRLPTDIAAALTVIIRRPARARMREKRANWQFDLSGSDLRGSSFVQADLERAFLFETHLERTNLSEVHLEGAVLVNAHLERAFLSGARLEGADLKGANLGYAFLRGAHLGGANFMAAHLEHVSLMEAHLERAHLSFAHLEGADLSGAHLEGAVLIQAHLEKADLSEAQLEGADLREAHLEGAILAGRISRTPTSRERISTASRTSTKRLAMPRRGCRMALAAL
jgi:uncharacterized protein YjbI with pentapeptide repeats